MHFLPVCLPSGGSPKAEQIHKPVILMGWRFVCLGHIFVLEVNKVGEKLFLFYSDSFHTVVLTELNSHTYPFHFSCKVMETPPPKIPALHR